ncbi:hypothetical protein EDC18_106122 [Natranaerovirga pectinivora]|uniref:Nitrogen regulatory protein P-II family n=1 Tax=Natranaerovirga pectinivora TaxID=682400 RepID=A0A4R3MJ79_9FIRM|nr:hypothetical protein [Natranaerovirga pectinivora]TCT14324.1 hypothetical protein EDC18_106122 [Natranaerovirga pectinivora]
MESQYILFIIINDTKSFKQAKEKLKNIGITSYTVIDTMGATSLFDKDDIRYASFMPGIVNQENKQFNKTIFIALENEEKTVKVMDEVEKVLYSDGNHRGKGIMFTVPIYKSLGITNFNK